MTCAEQAWQVQATRLYRRYSIEVIERLKLCPWAASARSTGSVAEHVVLQAKVEDFSPLLGVIRELAQASHVDIALIIFPRLVQSRAEFSQFVSELGRRDAAQHELGCIPFAMAEFHPEATPDLSSAERLVSFVRRTPDPTIQLVRHVALRRVRGDLPQGTEFVSLEHWMPEAHAPAPSLRERILASNLKAVQDFGVEQLEAIFDDIQLDRERTYSALPSLGESARGE